MLSSLWWDQRRIEVPVFMARASEWSLLSEKPMPRFSSWKGCMITFTMMKTLENNECFQSYEFLNARISGSDHISQTMYYLTWWKCVGSKTKSTHSQLAKTGFDINIVHIFHLNVCTPQLGLTQKDHCDAAQVSSQILSKAIAATLKAR